ncbi:MAG: hypothetical protein GY805_08545, partial [Chloroflexi bacterium]|nr:hypothetical protein [Chloroflexota bacterium]
MTNFLPAKLFFLLLWFVLAGCVPTELQTLTPTKVLPSATAVSSSPQPSATPPPMPTVTATPLPTSEPTATAILVTTPTEASPDVLALPAGEVVFNGVRFQLNGRLANQIYPLEETWDDLTYTVFKFAPEGLCREVGCIEVYDVAAYEAAHPDFPLPPLGAATILSAQKQTVAFQNGDGSRSVLMRGQDGYFANNEALLYDFHGFTEDGRFYILVTIPIDASILLSTFDPAENSNSNAIPVPDDLPTDYIELSNVIFEYNQEIVPQLDLLTAVDFTPGLDLLDALVTSLQIADPSPPAPTATPLPTTFVGPLQQVTTLDPTLSDDVVSLRLADDGRIWLATSNQFAVWGNGRWQTYPATDFRIREILPAANGDLWLASDNGLFIFDDPSWTFLSPTDMDMNDPLDPDYYTQYVLEQVGNQVWVGRCDWGGPGPFGGGGVRWFDGTGWRGGESVVADGCVTSIHEDAQGRVWVAVDTDLWRYDPATDVWDWFAPPEPPPEYRRFGFISDLVVDPSGNPWPLYILCGGASCMGAGMRYQWQDGVWVQVREDIAFPQQLLFDSVGTPWLFFGETGFQLQTDSLVDIFAPSFVVDAVSTDAAGQIWLVGRADGGEMSLWRLQPEMGGVSETAVCPTSANNPLPSISADAPGQSIAEIFEPQIISYLNAGGNGQGLVEQLQNLTLDIGGGTIWQAMLDTPFVTDVTGDETEEVILNLQFYESNQYFNGEIFVFHCQNGGYVGGSIASLAGGVVGEQPDTTLLAVRDMNGNGRSEIVFTYVTVVGTHVNFTREVRIVEWDGAQFVDLIRSEGNNPRAAEVLNASSPFDIIIEDVNGNGFLELALTNGAGRGPDA